GVSVMTVKRRLGRGLQALAASLGTWGRAGRILPRPDSTPAGENSHHDRRPAGPATARRTARLTRHARRGLRVVPRTADRGPRPRAQDVPHPGRPRRPLPALG